jgi:hypothetical protein
MGTLVSVSSFNNVYYKNVNTLSNKNQLKSCGTQSNTNLICDFGEQSIVNRGVSLLCVESTFPDTLSPVTVIHNSVPIPDFCISDGVIVVTGIPLSEKCSLLRLLLVVSVDSVVRGASLITLRPSSFSPFPKRFFFHHIDYCSSFGTPSGLQPTNCGVSNE